MAFSSGNADAGINEYRYNDYEETKGITEAGYYLLMKVFSGSGIPFATYKQIIAAIELSLIGSTILKLATNTNVVLALYILYPFCMDVVQMRYTLALSIVIFSFRFLLDNKNKIRNSILFAILIIVASLFHSLSIFYIFLLAVKVLSVRNTVFIAAIIDCVGIAIFNPLSLLTIANAINMTDKLNTYLANPTTFGAYRGAIILIFSFLLTFGFAYAFSIKRIPLHEISDFDISVIKINILALCIIPFLTLAPDFFRIQIGISLLNYITITNHLSKTSSHEYSILLKPVKNIYMICLLYVMAFINLYILVLGNTNIDTVFIPLWFSNTLLK
ncbi:EpsG family protein [Bifidobacterium sp. MA2]|uniref:EpsG family protein n=2 Tax=Bifidobacterium santillanense TaxID=2809028 RepID=A0ABS5UQI2_9BIFI|nr:EpsG family protein [Bifidobacterium santillanense]